MEQVKAKRSEMRLYNEQRERLYINRSERQLLLDVAPTLPLNWQALLLTLIYTGCRASELLELTPGHLQADDGVLAIRSLKKRNNEIIMREIPIPHELCNVLIAVRKQNDLSEYDLYWPISRKTVWRKVKQIMAGLDITGAHANPKGLRHGFGIQNIQSGVDLGTVCELMGHSSMKVTVIYTRAVGGDLRERVSQAW